MSDVDLLSLISYPSDVLFGCVDNLLSLVYIFSNHKLAVMLKPIAQKNP